MNALPCAGWRCRCCPGDQNRAEQSLGSGAARIRSRSAAWQSLMDALPCTGWRCRCCLGDQNRAGQSLGATFVPGWQSLTLTQQQWRSPTVRTHGDSRQRRQRTENEQGRMRALRQKAALEHTAADISCIDRALWTSVFSALWSYLRQHLMLSLSL